LGTNSAEAKSSLLLPSAPSLHNYSYATFETSRKSLTACTKSLIAALFAPQKSCGLGAVPNLVRLLFAWYMFLVTCPLPKVLKRPTFLSCSFFSSRCVKQSTQLGLTGECRVPLRGASGCIELLTETLGTPTREHDRLQRVLTPCFPSKKSSGQHIISRE
jgi:hypothetical protein